MKFAARWRKGFSHYTLLILLPVIGLASCHAAVSETSSSPPPATPPTESAGETQPDIVQEAPLNPQLLSQGQVLPVTAEVELNGQLIGLEVAETPQQQAIGLMAREALADDRGMLFPFEPARPVSFWMKNVLIPLDMVFIREGEIVAIASDVPPCETNPCPTYGPDNQAVDYVMELRGGLAAELDLQKGDAIDITWLEGAQSADE